MGEWRWDLMVLKDFSTLAGVDTTITAEVLAEMGAERVWVCHVHGLIDPYIVGEFNQEWCKPLHQGRGCGYYQIVKEADDE